MTNKNNFKWLEDDINNTLVLKVVSEGKNYGVYNVLDILETTGDELEIKTANIDDLTNLLTLGIVRFVNIVDQSDILDIPFRKLYILYRDANVLGETSEVKEISFSELDIFSVIDGVVRNDFSVISSRIAEISEDLSEVIRISYDFGSYGMQEKFDAMSKITMINHRRLLRDEKEGRAR